MGKEGGLGPNNNNGREDTSWAQEPAYRQADKIHLWRGEKYSRGAARKAPEFCLEPLCKEKGYILRGGRTG